MGEWKNAYNSVVTVFEFHSESSDVLNQIDFFHLGAVHKLRNALFTVF